MEKSDWSTVVAQAPRTELKGLAWRIVESQEEIATMALVDNLEEQALLETLLEQSKPPYPESASHLDYLLITPFRYPPLPWGSRFGIPFEPSLYYASLTIPTALAEAAFYRFVFWQGMEISPLSGRLLTQHTIFSAQFSCDPGFTLDQAPFDAFCKILTDKQNYGPCQSLGSALREADAQGFQYVSARCPDGGLNIALFTPEALTSRKPEETQNWLCETREDYVSFKGPHYTTHTFGIDVFEVNGSFPSPA